jgi:DNA repair protein RecO (recombination protein O)
MLSERTDALVLKTVPYSNTSLIVTFYTEKYGRLTAIAKGARRRQHTIEGAIETLSLGEAFFYIKKNRSMATLKDYDAFEDFSDIRKSLERFYAACAVIEYLLEGVADYESEPELFSLAVSALDAIAKGHFESAVAAFIIQALNIAGVFPSVTNCSVCSKPLPKESPLLYATTHKAFLCSECIALCPYITFPPQVGAIISGILRVGNKLRTLQLPKQLLPRLLRLATVVFELNFGKRLHQTEKLIAEAKESVK